MSTITEAPRPEDDKAWFEDGDVSLEFRECDTCKAKPGTPVLCEGCLHNRAVIGRLRGHLQVAPPPELQQACVTLLGEIFVSHGGGANWGMLSAPLRVIVKILREMRSRE